MKDGLIEDRDLIFTLALCPLDNHEAMHMMMLQTIYKKLTATDLDCPRYGAHWESIGFQGICLKPLLFKLPLSSSSEIGILYYLAIGAVPSVSVV